MRPEGCWEVHGEVPITIFQSKVPSACEPNETLASSNSQIVQQSEVSPKSYHCQDRKLRQYNGPTRKGTRDPQIRQGQGARSHGEFDHLTDTEEVYQYFNKLGSEIKELQNL